MMKKIFHLLSMLTVAVLLTPLTTACSSDELDPPFSLSTPMRSSTVHISVDAGISDEATRSAIDYTNGTRTLQFTAGDKLFIRATVGTNANNKNIIISGFLTVKTGSINADGTSAQFEGDLNVAEQSGSSYVLSSHTFSTSDPLAECQQYCTDNSVSGGMFAQLVHEGTESSFTYFDDLSSFLYGIGSYSHTGDVQPATADDLLTQWIEVKATSYDIDNHCFNLATDDHSAIFNCTLSGLPASMRYKIEISHGGYYVSGKYMETDATGLAQFAFEYPETYWGNEYTYTFTLTNTTDSSDKYSFEIGPVTLQKKVYNIRRYWLGSSFATTVVDLTTVTDNILVRDGMTLTGTLTGNYKISIASGATVTLKDVDITNLGNNCNWAAINCVNDATLVLEGTNTLCAGKDENGWIFYPAIWIAQDKTLTIRGNGSLTADNRGNAPISLGSGIGGGSGINCGNIVIESGTINATGGTFGTGIGGDRCGDITIKGGTITAISGDHDSASIGSMGSNTGNCGNIVIEGGNIIATNTGNGAAIGCGYLSDCGDITIKGGTVTATGGSQSAGIGNSRGTCGNINITGGTVTATGGWHGAGIGSGDAGHCGNISISGTMTKVTATGGNYAPGIGIGSPEGAEDDALDDGDGGYIPAPVCGTINITGGTITATGGSRSAAIGAGCNYYANDITITNTVTKVTATKGSNAKFSIATIDSHKTTYHTLTIGGIVTGNISDSPYIYQP